MVLGVFGVRDFENDHHFFLRSPDRKLTKNASWVFFLSSKGFSGLENSKNDTKSVSGENRKWSQTADSKHEKYHLARKLLVISSLVDARVIKILAS